MHTNEASVPGERDESSYVLGTDDGEIARLGFQHRAWSELAEGEREELSRKNYRRFLDKWGHREDLLVSSQGRG